MHPIVSPGCRLSASPVPQAPARWRRGIARLARAVLLPLVLLALLLVTLDRYERSRQARHWRLHRVGPGEDLRSLAAHYYRDPARWPLIFQANRRRLVGRDGLHQAELLLIPPLEQNKR